VEGRKLKDMFGSQAKPQAEEGRNTMAHTGPVTETSSKGAEGAPKRKAKTLQAKDVNLFYGDFHAVEGVNMTIEPNKVTALIGSSGCGKTTFLRSLNRMHELTPNASVKGDIELDGEDIYAGGVDPVAVRRLIGMVFQQPNPFPTMSIYDNVAAGLNFNAGKISKSDKDGIVEKSLRGAHLWDEVKDRLGRPGSGLSGGQQQRLCIARATAVSPEVLLMDEPCSALDPVATLAIEDLIGELKKEYTIAIVTHNMQQAARASDNTAFFNLEQSGKPGRLIEIGPTEQIFTKPTEKATEDYVSGRFG
jgi:phosphate transport system ATP-binding protein